MKLTSTLNKKLFKQEILEIPSIRDDKDGFYRLYDLLFSTRLEPDIFYFIHIKFSSCNFAGYNLTVLLGAFIKKLKENNNVQVEIETKTMNKQVFNKLKNMKLLNSFLPPGEIGFIPNEEVISYRCFLKTDKENDILEYLKEEWIGVNRINLSKEVKASVLSSLWEIYANAFEHSHSDSVFCSGSYDKKEKTLTLLVGDLGLGITDSINTYLETTFKPRDAVEWALIRGHSTYTANIKESGKEQPRGLGFDILRQLVDINNGSMDIFTDTVHYQRLEKNNFFHATQKIAGCWIRLKLHCKNDVLYCFETEASDYPEYF
jgi:hypothetical protein